jgi:hypothetical protein
MISGSKGYIPTVFHEDIIFSHVKALPQARKKRRKKSRFVIWLNPRDI